MKTMCTVEQCYVVGCRFFSLYYLCIQNLFLYCRTSMYLPLSNSGVLVALARPGHLQTWISAAEITRSTTPGGKVKQKWSALQLLRMSRIFWNLLLFGLCTEISAAIIVSVMLYKYTVYLVLGVAHLFRLVLFSDYIYLVNFVFQNRKFQTQNPWFLMMNLVRRMSTRRRWHKGGWVLTEH